MILIQNLLNSNLTSSAYNASIETCPVRPIPSKSDLAQSGLPVTSSKIRSMPRTWCKKIKPKNHNHRFIQLQWWKRKGLGYYSWNEPSYFIKQVRKLIQVNRRASVVQSPPVLHEKCVKEVWNYYPFENKVQPRCLDPERKKCWQKGSDGMSAAYNIDMGISK
jgi:hypothetical protein